VATGSPDSARAALAIQEAFVDYKVAMQIDWPATFPSLRLGPHRDPRELAEQIRKDVDKLKSCSAAARFAIREERCARAGITVYGVPCFDVNRTE